ncbi:hypothetical protein EC988_001085 [Linderina pennispora]|nr:hypothetical protein EC988_001085 [Linderina pennispora]
MWFAQTCPALEGQSAIWWLDRFFGTCIYNYTDAASSLLGTLTIGLWFVALLPQIYENWLRKSTDGLSTHFMFLWLIGDSMNTLGCIILKQRPFQIFLSSYFVVSGIILIIQYFLYRGNAPRPTEPASDATEYTSLLPSSDDGRKMPWQRKSVWFMVAWIVGVALFWTVVRHWHVIGSSISMQAVGMAMAWGSTMFFHISRLPQLWLNWKRQSVEGLAKSMFMVTFSANGTYAISLIIIMATGDADVFRRSLAFLYGAIGSMLLDVFVLMQCHMFDRRAKPTHHLIEA